MWGQLTVRCALRVALYLWGVKISFVKKWVEGVILTTMGQYTFFNFISFLCTALFCFAFWEKKRFLFFFFFNFLFFFSFFFFRLAEMGHHSNYILLTSDITTFFISISQIRVLMFRLFAVMFQNSLYLFCQYAYVTILLQVFWNIEWLYRMSETSSDCIAFFTKDLCTECWIWRLSSESFAMYRIICCRIEA